MKYVCKFASNNDVTTIVHFTESYLPIDNCIQKDICIHIFKEVLNDNNQKSNEVYYKNEFKGT